MNKKDLPGLIFGTSCLGNLYQVMGKTVKQELIDECFSQTQGPIMFDSAGKYGAGLALESLGACLKNAGISPEDVIISNKLGWLRTDLTTPEPLFGPGVWMDLEYDAVQPISYEGIIACHEQGNELLGDYSASLVSVHDPDEYLAAAKDEEDSASRYHDILEAYRALFDLKKQGFVKSVGVGAKNWRVIQRISKDVKLDWVMIANSMTIHSHPSELLTFMQTLRTANIPVINSAVFNGGFLTGSDFYNYSLMNREDNAPLYIWREKFYAVCNAFGISPAQASVAFARRIPGVTAIALSTTKPQNVAINIKMATTDLSDSFWQALIAEELINPDLQQYLTN